MCRTTATSTLQISIALSAADIMARARATVIGQNLEKVDEENPACELQPSRASGRELQALPDYHQLSAKEGAGGGRD